MKNKNLVLGTLLVGAAVAGPSMAAGAVTYDVSDALPYFAALIAAITLIGTAKLGPAAVAVGFKWLKATIFS